MASVSESANGTRRLLFVDGDGTRRAVYLGEIPKKAAETVKANVEAILTATLTGTSIPRETAAWLGLLPDEMRAKFEKVGLVEARAKREASPTVAGYVAAYITKRSHQRPNTLINLRRAESMLTAFTGTAKRIDQFTKSDASDWWHGMLSDGYAVATASRIYKRGKQFFAAAVEATLIPSNPLASIKAPKQNNPARLHTVPADVAREVIAAATDETFGLAIAFSRFGGVRVPSELVGLRWEDIDREKGRFLVRSPKKKDTRAVPLYPELAEFLPDVFGKGRIFPDVREDSNLGERLSNTIARAGVEQWPRLWQNLRASRQTELSAIYPATDVCAWMGNTPAVAADHYLSTLDASFARASSRGAMDDAQDDARTTRRTTQTATGQKRPEPTGSTELPIQREVSRILSALAATCRSVHVPPRGIEPLS